MKSIFVLFFAGLLSIFSMATEPPAVVVIPINGEISTAQFFFLRRALKNAETTQSTAVIIEMNTYGGSLKAAVDMQDALQKCQIPTFTFINTNAGSAGALVALSTKKIYMAPVSAIGAAAPVSSGGEELPSTLSDKLISYFSGYFRSAAEKNGYNPEIAEAFINKSKEVKIGEEIVHPKGSVLTLASQEAIKVIGGKPLLASGILSSLQDLVHMEHLNAPVRLIQSTGFEKIAFWITTLAPFFLMIGIVGAYLEFKLQGTLIPGLIAAIAFVIFFAGHYIAGLSGWEVPALFVLGSVLVISELTLHPGTIIPGVVGAMLMLASLLWAMIDYYPGEPWIPTTQMLWVPLRNLGIALAAATLGCLLLARFLPHTTLYRRMVLGKTNPPGPSFSKSTVGSNLQLKIGDTGVAQSILRPCGTALFGSLHVDVITQGEFVEPHSKIRILAIEGMRVVVESI